MLLIPILINSNTDYMVDLQSNREVNDSFLIYAGNKVDFIHFYNNENTPKGISVQGDRGLSIKYVTFRNDVEQTETNGVCREKLTIELLDKPEQNNADNPWIIDKGRYSFDVETQTLSYNHLSNPNSLPICLEVEIVYRVNDNNTLRKTLMFYFYGNRAEVYESVIDCGSEATQISFQRQDEGANVNVRVNVLKGILDERYPGNETADRDYIQYDEHSDHLFRSLFYVKNEIAPAEINNLTPNYCSVTDEGEDSPRYILDNVSFEDCPLKILVKRKALENGDLNGSHIKLCNMKVSAFGGVTQREINYGGHQTYVTNIGDNYFYRRYLNEFLHIVLSKFNGIAEDPNQGVRPKFLSLYMLMPNVYSPAKVQKCLDDMVKDINRMIELNEEFKKNILGFTVNAISESDASLIGADTLRGERPLDDGIYLIMDAGKGTLDYSLTRKQDGKYVNIMKGGIVGASAAISYGFVLDLLNRYIHKRNTECGSNIGPASLRDGVKAIMEGTPKLLHKLMAAVDDYKIRYCGLNAEIPNVVADPSADKIFDYDAFVEWIEKLNYKVDSRYVNKIIDIIVTNVKEDLSEKRDKYNIDNVIFAGRGFLYEGLKTAMSQSIRKINPKANMIELNRNNAVGYKNLCLYICRFITEGRYNYRTLPDVYLHNGVAPQQPAGKKEDKKTSLAFEPDSKKNSYIKDCCKFIEKIPWKKIIKNVFTRNEIPDRRMQRQPQHQIGEIDSPFVKGYKFSNVVNDDRISIAGTTYNMPYGVNSPVQMFIANGKIYLRDRNGVVNEPQELGNVDVALAFPSLFPDCSTNNIYIPELTDMSDDGNASNENKTGNTPVKSLEQTPSNAGTATNENDGDDNPWAERENNTKDAEEQLQAEKDAAKSLSPNNGNDNDDPWAGR